MTEAEQLAERIKKIEDRLNEAERKKAEDERKNLRTALIAAGAIITALLGYIWIQVIQPVLPKP